MQEKSSDFVTIPSFIRGGLNILGFEWNFYEKFRFNLLFLSSGNTREIYIDSDCSVVFLNPCKARFKTLGAIGFEPTTSTV